MTVPQAENRLLFMQVGMFIVPARLIVFAWSAEKQLHWAVKTAVLLSFL